MAECAPGNCEKRLSDLEKRTESHEIRIKRIEADDEKATSSREKIFARLEALDRESERHRLNIEHICSKLESIEKQTAEIDRKLDEINNRPAKDMNQFKNAIIGAVGSAVGTGVIAFILYVLSQTVK